MSYLISAQRWQGQCFKHMQLFYPVKHRAEALSALISLNGPDHPHLGLPTPMAP